MPKRLSCNRNLHEHIEDTFKGLKFYDLRGPVATQYLECIYDVMNKSLDEHPRTLTIRVDLKYPKRYDRQKPEGVIGRFIERMKYDLARDYKKRKARNVRAHWTSLRYVGCRESTPKSKEHYHLMLFINKDAYFQLGCYNSTDKGLAAMIRRAWARAIGIQVSQLAGAVHFPDNPIALLNRNSDAFEEHFAKVFYRASYLAKADTKSYGNGYRSFSCSRN